MTLVTRTQMTGLLMAAALVLAPLQAGHAVNYGTSNPQSGLNMGEMMQAQNMISSMSLAQANGFNIQGLASASLGSMLGSAVTNAMGIDGILGNVVQGVITAGVMQGMEKLGAGGAMGNFGGLLSTSLNSVILNQIGIQGGSLSANNSFGGFSNAIVAAAATSALQAATSGGGGGDMLQSVATAAVAGGIQGAMANTASLNQ